MIATRQKLRTHRSRVRSTSTTNTQTRGRQALCAHRSRARSMNTEKHNACPGQTHGREHDKRRARINHACSQRTQRTAANILQRSPHNHTNYRRHALRTTITRVHTKCAIQNSFITSMQTQESSLVWESSISTCINRWTQLHQVWLPREKQQLQRCSKQHRHCGLCCC